MMTDLRQDVLDRLGVAGSELDAAGRMSPRVRELCRDLETVGAALGAKNGLEDDPAKAADLELVRLERELEEEVRLALARLKN